MMEMDARFVFHGAQQYAFLYENAHLLLVTFDRDDAKLLFLIQAHSGDVVTLAHPGERFTATVLDTVLPIFFIQVHEDGQTSGKRYVLGSFFWAKAQRFGAYYAPDGSTSDVVLFKIQGEAPNFTLEVPDAPEYTLASRIFADQHADMLSVQFLEDHSQ